MIKPINALKKMQNLHLTTMVFLFTSFLLLLNFSSSQTQKTAPYDHIGPVLSLPINLYLIWYGQWTTPNQTIIRNFINSFSPPPSASIIRPSVSDWWATVTLYTDQTDSKVTKTITLSGEFHDPGRSTQRTPLTRLSMQHIIQNAVGPGKLRLDYTNGLYLVLTSGDVVVQDFCRAICGFHQFTFQSIVGATVPYAWVGNSGSQCPRFCAYPFALPEYRPPNMKKLLPPNGDIGIDAMISIIAHELAEASTNPLINTWYAGNQLAPMEIADMCQGIYGTGGGPGVGPGNVYIDRRKNYGYNLNGVNGSKFLLQWVWHPAMGKCYGPNAKG